MSESGIGMHHCTEKELSRDPAPAEPASKSQRQASTSLFAAISRTVRAGSIKHYLLLCIKLNFARKLSNTHSLIPKGAVCHDKAKKTFSPQTIVRFICKAYRITLMKAQYADNTHVLFIALLPR